MNGITAVSPFNHEWFNFTGPFAVVKEECLDKFNEAIAQKRKQDTESTSALNEKMSKRNTDIVLTDEQKAQLSKKYDPKSMSKDEYDSFIDDLCTYGVMQQEDKEIISHGVLVPLILGPDVQITSQTKSCWMNLDYNSCNGNALDWTKYLSSFESYNPIKQTFEKDARAILFSIITSAMEQISG